jgi:hypothetical protein
MGTQDDDWGNDLDDYGAEEWEALLGGPDDVDIDNYLQSIGADDLSQFQECDDAKAISTQTEVAREHSFSCPEQDLQKWVGSAFQPSYLHLLPLRLLPFGKRTVGVAVIRKATLVLVDPKGQTQIDDDKLRVFVVRTGQLAIIYRRTRMRTCTEKQALMAAALYRTFLNPTRRGLYKQPAKAKGLPSAKKPTPASPLPKAISSIRFHEHEQIGTVIYWPKERAGKRIKVYFADELEKPVSDRLHNIRLSTFERSFPKSESQPATGSISYWEGAVSAYIADLLEHIDKYDANEFADSEFAKSLTGIFDGDVSVYSVDQLLRFLADLSDADMVTGGYRPPEKDWEHALLLVHNGLAAPATYREQIWSMYRANTRAFFEKLLNEQKTEGTDTGRDTGRHGLQHNPSAEATGNASATKSRESASKSGVPDETGKEAAVAAQEIAPYPYRADGRVNYLALTPEQLTRYEAHKAKFGEPPTKATAHLLDVAAPAAKPTEAKAATTAPIEPMNFNMKPSENIWNKLISTFDAIMNGWRTSTTRGYWTNGVPKVGQQLTFKHPDGRTVLVKVTSVTDIKVVPAKDSEFAKQWVEKEGWTYDAAVARDYFKGQQVTFELVEGETRQ